MRINKLKLNGWKELGKRKKTGEENKKYRTCTERERKTK